MTTGSRASLAIRIAAEALGTLLLVTAVVGSGVMAERLTSDAALTLLANTLATAAMLVVLVTILGPVSGAHIKSRGEPRLFAPARAAAI